MKTVLIVDDMSTNIDLLREILKGSYRLKMAKNGHSALKIINADEKPDIVLLDIMMPEMDGYEVCQKIKANPDTSMIPVIFISTLSSSEEQIKGFEAGADDYIPKPVDPDNLIAKIHNAFDNQEKLESSKDQLNYAQSTAMTALTTISEMGYISNYFSTLPSIQNIDDLAQHILDFAKQFELSAIIKIDCENFEPFYQSTTGVVRPMEISLIDKLKSKGAVFNFKSGTVFNYEDISLLIIDMPIGNEEFYGRLKDHIATIVAGSSTAVEAISSRIKMLSMVKSEHAQVDKLSTLVSTIESALGLVEQLQAQQQQENAEIMSDLVNNIQELFFHLGLSEMQEEQLLNLITSTDSKIQDLFDKNVELEQKFSMIRALIHL